MGDLASPNATSPPPKAEGIETLQLDNQEETPEEEPLPAAAVKSLKPTKTQVPDFDKFRLLSILGVLLLIVLVVGWYVAFVVMPRAKINIKTKCK